MSPSSNHDESAVAAVLISMKNEATEACKRNLLVLKKAVPPRTKSGPSSKKTQSTKFRKKCMFRICGKVDFTKENEVIVQPVITCSKIVKGKKVTIQGNVMCNSCGKCFCSSFMKETMKKYAMKRNCFEKHRELDGSVCKDATFTPLSRMTCEDYDKIYNEKALKNTEN